MLNETLFNISYLSIVAFLAADKSTSRVSWLWTTTQDQEFVISHF